ncbi:hypothetical protein [Blastomonas sp.]|uniref:hypothetical protein n=1 Tax=Blastomonas sp. TaxID=1909299 RepID=UPI0035936A16
MQLLQVIALQNDLLPEDLGTLDCGQIVASNDPHHVHRQFLASQTRLHPLTSSSSNKASAPSSK